MKRLPYLAIIAALATLVDNLALGASLNAGAFVHAPLSLIALTLPSILFAPLGAKLVDRYGIQKALHIAKVLELVGIATCASAGFGFPPGIYVSLLVLGTKGALLAPIKYAGAPRLGNRGDELLRASMLVATATAVSMVIGIVGGWYLQHSVGYGTFAACLGALAIMGWLMVPAASGRGAAHTQEPSAPLVMSPQTLNLSLVGIGWFWALAALFVGLMVPFGITTLGGTSQTVTYLITCLAGGFIVGALTCSWLSRGVLELGVVPLGALGITVWSAALFIGGVVAQPMLLHAYLGAAFVGMSLAWYAVPLYALIYHRNEPSQTARVAARCDRISSALAVAAAAVLWVAYTNNWPAHWMFLTLAAMNAAVAFFIYAYMPEFALRFVVWLLAHVLYRVRVVGRDNLPLRGPAVLVCNHITFIDWLIIGSASPLPLRFVMHYSFMNIPVAKYLFKDAKIIPIAGAKEDPETLEKAFERISAALADNEIVCIFPEGKLTTDGKMNVFRPGIEKIVGRNPVPVVPMALVGMWGSMFSKNKDKRLGKRIWSKVTLLVEPEIPAAQVTAADLEARVKRLGNLE